MIGNRDHQHWVVARWVSQSIDPRQDVNDPRLALIRAGQLVDTVAVGYSLDDVLATLQSRFAEELRLRDAAGFETWTRDRWYVSLLHFAGPVTDSARVAQWCDARRDRRIGEVALDHAEVIRWHFVGDGVRAESLHLARLGSRSATSRTA